MEWSYELQYDKLDEINTNLLELIEGDFNGVPITIEPEYGLKTNGERSSTAVGNSIERRVRFSQLSNQMLWYVCWYAFQIVNGKSDSIDTKGLLQRLHIIDRHRPEFESMSCKDLDSWNNESLSYIFAYATNFIICHEICHIVKGHTLTDGNLNFLPSSTLKEQEFEADAYAMNVISSVGRKNSQTNLSNLGVVCAQCYMFFERKKDEDYTNDCHGDPMVRIEQKLGMMDGDLTNLWNLVNSLKALSDIFIEEKYN